MKDENKENVELSYNTESEEIADITERVINELPMKIISSNKAELLVTGFHNPDKIIRGPLDRAKAGMSMLERFMTPFEGSSKIYSQMNLVSGKVEYTNPNEIKSLWSERYYAGKSRRRRYEFGVSIFLDPIIQIPFLMFLDKKFKTELVIYLSYDRSKNLKKHLMGYQRNHKRNQINNVK